ncbi:hypothetical protein TRFO_01700 [Tritrichomonas foetus]|uniref:HECT-type E3 ubiquitin transferase n=1 Tax=Tritrichomonas foetus TaxID=1144522 RepID=A0A1J4JUB1_9EUKA|nr:hypothetical protein TRFO_01700 [Tritrichomonas foetus]|eukprot:OHT01110.1 hypothetical protein TRFO_01700 [Tritrichomonas foetus]
MENDYYDAYEIQYTRGCECISCHFQECFSCPNFVYKKKTKEELLELANTNRYSKDKLCPNLSPIIVNPMIFADIDDFSDFVSSFIESPNGADYSIFEKTIQDPSVFSLTFMQGDDATYEDFSVDEETLVKFMQKSMKMKYKLSQYNSDIKNLILHYLLNENNRSIHYIRGLLLSFSLMHILPYLDFQQCCLNLYHLAHQDTFFNLLKTYHLYGQLVVESLNQILTDLIAITRNVPQVIDSITHLIIMIVFIWLHNQSGVQTIPRASFINEHILCLFSIENILSELQDTSKNSPLSKICFLTTNTKYLIYELGIKRSMTNRIVTSLLNSILKIEVNRDNLLDDTMRVLTSVYNKSDFLKPLQVTFIGEKGHDEGGVSREFFHLVILQLFSPDFGMFDLIDKRFYWFREKCFNINSFYMAGILVGLAIYNSIMLPIKFPNVFYKKLCNYVLTIEDLEEIEPDLTNSLKSLEALDDDAFVDLDMRFSIDVENFGAVEHVPLIENGENVLVNKSNLKDYISSIIQWKLVKSIERQFLEFQRGFYDVLGPTLINIFYPDEIGVLVSGLEQYNWTEFKENTVYSGYDADSNNIKLFWDVFNELEEEQKINFLMFATGSKSVPVGGLKNTALVIQKTSGNSFPVAHTCSGILQLPVYESKEEMKSKLLICCEYCEGFGII